MNKKVLNMMLCSLLVGSMATSFVGCKDYDDDITEINGTTGALSQQIKDLNTALEAAKADAAAAKSAAEHATDAAEKAQAAAQAAAADAKAEALKEVIARTEALQQQISANTNLSQENAKALAELAGTIEGIQKGLASIDLTDVNKQLGTMANDIIEANKSIQAINIQLKALENYEETIKGLKDDIADLNEKLGEVATLKASLESLKSSVATDIKGVQDKLQEISGEITTKLASQLNTIAGVFSQRLTSVTLMPDLYVGGIPTIAFESAQYDKLEFKNNKWQKATTGKVNFIISNNETEAHYRLNPGTVTGEDIVLNEIAYVSRKATARSAEAVNDIVNVADAKVETNGQLTVYLGKSTTESLNRTDGKINTIALRVPIAEKHLFKAQGETSAEVYSEYTRVEEAYFQPELRFKNKDAAFSETHLYSDSTVLYNAATDEKVAKSIVYNEPYDLYDLVEGCKVFSADKHVAMTIGDARKYGLNIKFHVAKADYILTDPDKTNQQKFVKLSTAADIAEEWPGSNNVLTPQTEQGTVNNEAIIGKQPIIAATLYDKTNSNVVAVGYFKVKFTAAKMDPIPFDWSIDLNADPCDGVTWKMGWEEVLKNILENINIDGHNGMSKEDFNTIYGTGYNVTPANDSNGKFTVTVGTETQASIPVFQWEIGKTLLGHLVEGSNGPKTFTKTVTFHNAAGLYPDIVIKFTMNVTTNVDKVTLGQTETIKWGENNTMKVYVVPMQIPYIKGTSPKAHYATNILEGRKKAYLNGLNPCEYYDIDFAPNQGYVGKSLAFQSGYGHWLMTKANQANLDEIIYSIENNAQGQALVKNGKNITVNWYADVNGLRSNPDNSYFVGAMNLQVLKILSISPKSATAITDNSFVQTTDVAVEIRDAYGNLVAPETPANPAENEKYAAEYWDFYGVKDPTFLGEIKLSYTGNTSDAISLDGLNMTANVDTDGKLTFQNNGAPLQADAYLMVPVQVKHLWGSTESTQLTQTVAVPLKKNPNLSTGSRR